MPENLDPDSYINQKGKNSFLKFVESKIEIQNFIWESYYQELDLNNPHSLTLFEKKIRSLCSGVKDKTLAKYFLENYTKKINELTPNLISKKNNYFNYVKKENPLQKTKRYIQTEKKFCC